MENAKFYIFRNHTVEPFFTNFNAEFSGYGEIPEIKADSDYYVWFYQVSVNPENSNKVHEIEHFFNQILYLSKKIPSSKNFLLFTIHDLICDRWTNSEYETSEAIIDFNNMLRNLSLENSNIKIIDFNDFMNSVSFETLVNWKYYYTSFALLNPALSGKFQEWFLKKYNAILSKRKKCLVLDLDNTLWGGIIGEDGIEGIKIGNSYPGNCYADFQKYISEASKAGIMLSICSKNNENDANEVIQNHPDMVLKSNNFVAKRINWNNKVSNIKEIASELNIGLDSMVFIDDNPVEREIVQKAIPEITVPNFPKEPYNIVPFFKKVLSDHFQIYKLTNEDLEKTNQYRENIIRNNFKKEFNSIDEYLQNLEIEIEIKKADKFNINRLAQMTQKTNQFNLTSKRYSEIDLNKFIDDGHSILCASVKDKFGDNGITLLAIILNEPNMQAQIDTYLLSCRILGRGIEDVFLKFLLNYLYKNGIKRIGASYIQTSKNSQVAEFYEKNGFKLIESHSEHKKYIFEMDNELKINSFYKIIFN